MTTENDWLNAIDTAEAEGEARGRAEGRVEGEARGRVEGEARGRVEVARNLIAMGMSIEDIEKATGLTAEQIAELTQH